MQASRAPVRTSAAGPSRSSAAAPRGGRVRSRARASDHHERSSTPRRSRLLITRITSDSLPGMTRLEHHHHVALAEVEGGVLAPSEAREGRSLLPGCPSRRQHRAARGARAPGPPATPDRSATRGTARRRARPSTATSRGPRASACSHSGRAAQLASVPPCDVAQQAQAMHVGREHSHTTACFAPATISSSAWPTPSSLPSVLGVDVRRVAEEEADPSRDSSPNRSTSNISPSGGASSNLKSPVCTTSPASVRHGQRGRVRNRVVTRMGSTSNGPTRT